MVYIEDTDAYGIMYNSNYLRVADRALHMSASTSDEYPATALLNHSDEWNIVAVRQQQFKASPTLGSTFVVQGILQSATETTEVWDLWIGNNDTTYHTMSGVQISHKSNNFLDEKWLPEPAAFPSLSDSCKMANYTVFRDEFDGHLPGRLPVRSIMNLFERSRTDWLGGPEGLRRLQKEDERIFVVIGTAELSLVDGSVQCRPGDTVTVQTKFSTKKRGMRIECEHTAFCHGQRIAQGMVSLLTLDAKSRRPTSKLPQWLQDQLDLDNNLT